MARMYVDKEGSTTVVDNKDVKANVQAYTNSIEVFGASDIYDALRISIAYKLNSKELLEKYTTL